MKKLPMLVIVMITVMLMVAGCGGASPEFSVDTAPKYKDGESYPITLSVTDNGEAVTGMDILATLEMEKMDHGTIEVSFDDNGDGTYTGEVELPMGGEWIAGIEAELDGKTYDEILTFDVKEE